MANKVKNHSDETLNTVKELSKVLYATFLAKRTTLTWLSNETGLSTNSLKTILRGDTANIASYITTAKALGLALVLGSVNTPTSDIPPSKEVPEVSETFLK